MKNVLKATLLLAYLMSLAGFAQASQQLTEASCNKRYAQTEEECKAAEKWTPEAFTNVDRLENVEHFKIIFHSIAGSRWFGESAPKPGSWNEKLLQDPSLLSGNPKISTSVITDEKHPTFLGFVGFILEVQPTNIVGTCPRDAGSPPIYSYEEKNLSYLAEYSKFAKVDIKTPDQILSLTTKSEYNEIILTGKSETSEVKVKGILIRCNTAKMVRLNQMSDNDFNDYIKTQCKPKPWVEYDRTVISALNKLRQTYPMFGYETQK